jgi:NADH dehydrogenase
VTAQQLHRIVIVGGGAGGLELATRLGNTLGKRAQASITLVDAQLTHIWKPLLHEVAAGSLDAARDELNYMAQAKWNHFGFELGRMDGLDRDRRELVLAPQLDSDGVELVGTRTIAYDTLVLAVGSVCNDFGTPGVREHSIFLDSRNDAEALRRKLRDRFIAARSREGDRSVRIAVVGGGATGVELCAELHDSARLFRHYSSDDGAVDLKITLLEAGPRVLPALPERISKAVTDELRHKLDVDVRTGVAVRRAEADALYDADGLRIPADLSVWAAGIRAPAFLHELAGLENNRVDQLVVTATLQATRDPAVFAFGDCAACPLGAGRTGNVPPRAQAAHQQASLLADNLQRLVAGKPMVGYVYKDHGSLVSLASYTAFGDLFGGRMVEGRIARLFYVSLYRMHQAALYGWLKTSLMMVGGLLTRSTRPLLKLH